MKKRYIILNILVSVAIAEAQPIITDANMPQTGDQPSVVCCTDVPVESTLDAQTGANYTWDFSGLTTESTVAFDFVDPSSTLWADDFTGSNTCGFVPTNNAYAYYSSTSVSLLADGYRLILGPGDTLEQNYSDPEQIIDLPFTYNDNATDNFSGSGTGGGFPFTIGGSISYTADGYGTLVLPNATYNNVIRYRADRSETATVGGLGGTTITKDQWIWISADHRYWLLLMELIDDGAGIDDNVWYQSNPLPALTTGIFESTNGSFSVFPNPVDVNGSIQFSRALEVDAVVQIFDVNGRIVNQISGAKTISLEGVNAGIYLLKVLNGNGQTISAQKLIVQ